MPQKAIFFFLSWRRVHEASTNGPTLRDAVTPFLLSHSWSRLLWWWLSWVSVSPPVLSVRAGRLRGRLQTRGGRWQPTSPHDYRAGHRDQYSTPLTSGVLNPAEAGAQPVLEAKQRSIWEFKELLKDKEQNRGFRKSPSLGGTWVLPSVLRLTLDSGSGCDLRVPGPSPCGALRAVWSLLENLSPSAPLPAACPLSSSNQCIF